MDNSEKLETQGTQDEETQGTQDEETQGTQDEEKQSKKTMHYVLDTTICKQKQLA